MWEVGQLPGIEHWSAEHPSRSEQELDTAVRESLRSSQDPQPGAPLQRADLQRHGFYFEHQHPSSDTCGLNALNNMCQKKVFKIDDLQMAEAQMARAQDGGNFAQMSPVQNAPKGFFDVEALKIAADKVDVEIIDVEPVTDFQRSRCRAFVESARSSADGSWFLGFLVYDRRPGQMHYYALRRDGRYQGGAWAKLDSQLPREGEEVRNRWLSEENLRALYEASRLEFRDWLIRWFPVVYRSGASKEVCRVLKEDGYEVSLARAQTALRECGWALGQTTQHFLQELPGRTVREFLVKFARPSEVEMRSLLEAAQWDVTKAQQAIYQALQRRVALAQSVDKDTNTVRYALSLSDWDPVKAATLLGLCLQLGCSMDALAELSTALVQAGGEPDHAEAVLRLQGKYSGMSVADAVSLLRLAGPWSVQQAERVLQVRRRFPRASVSVCLEVLRRNDEDPHAAGEMLAEYEKRVQRLVAENSTGELVPGEEVAIAESALSAADWDPNLAFITAKNLAVGVQQTRQLIRSRGYKERFSVEVILPALTAGDMRPHTAASYLLGTPFKSDGTGQQFAQPVPQANSAAERERRAAAAAGAEEEDSMCSVS